MFDGRWILGIISQVSLLLNLTFESFSVRLPLSPSRLRGIPSRDFSIATISASSRPTRLPSSCRRTMCQVWSLILQRDGKRSAEYTEQRYRVACSLARRSEGGGEEGNKDLCETITRGGKIRPRRYHSDTDGYSYSDEKI